VKFLLDSGHLQRVARLLMLAATVLFWLYGAFSDSFRPAESVTAK
jgi:hypothetical protein